MTIIPLLSSRASISSVLCIFISPPKRPARCLAHSLCLMTTWDDEPRIQPLSSQASWPRNQWPDAMVQTSGVILLPCSLFKASKLFWEARQTKYTDCLFYEEKKKSLRDQGKKLKKGWNTPHGGHHYFKMLDFVTGIIYPLNAWSAMGKNSIEFVDRFPALNKLIIYAMCLI